jgi:hypothetical protein
MCTIWPNGQNQRLNERGESTVVKFKYRWFRDKSRPSREFRKLPLLQVRLAHGHNHIDLDCLVDSGAADCIFGTEVAEVLGIDLDRAAETQYVGIAGEGLTGRVHPVKLRVQGFSGWIEVEAGFIEVDQIPILGQSGFFDNYEVRFEGYKKRFEVKSRPDLQTEKDKYLM